MAEHNLSHADIFWVEVFVNKISYDNLMFSDPKTEMEARFSMEYAIALAITKGVLKLADFRPDAIANETLQAWFPRIKMTLCPVDNPLETLDNGREPAEVHIHTHDGRRLEIFLQRARGVLQNPLTEDEMWAKFDDCTDGVMNPARAAEVRSHLEHFETLETVSELMHLLRAES
jgi:2-methylcitrate dehydratase PrpD